MYVCGVLLPVVCAFLRRDIMPALGVPAFAVLFWTGPFASAAAVMWNDWSVGRRAAWILLVPVFIAATFVLLLVPFAVE